MPGRLDGKVALVTGSARGIGRACAVRFAEEGADVALVDIGRNVETVPYPGARADQLAEAAGEIERLGRRAVAASADVRDGEAMQAAAARAVEELGRIDVLVAAAGIDSWGNAWELTDDQWRTMIDVNLTGVWQSAKAVTPHMLEQGSGAMVLIGSVLSHKHNPGFAHYTAAKHGVLGLTRALALELAPHMIRVNSVDPTAVRTDMTINPEFLGELSGRESGTVDDAEERLRRWNAMPLLMIEPVDVANACLFLASEEARYITGASLPVDLGAMLKEAACAGRDDPLRHRPPAPDRAGPDRGQLHRLPARPPDPGRPGDRGARQPCHTRADQAGALAAPPRRAVLEAVR
jgi:SDR family mycofactocin-dependent oxidoreductase